MQNIFFELAVRADILERFRLTPHTLRHFFATEFLSETGDLALTQCALPPPRRPRRASMPRQSARTTGGRTVMFSARGEKNSREWFKCLTVKHDELDGFPPLCDIIQDVNEFYSGQEFKYIKRWITPLLRTATSEHRVVVLTGARQVGKSTLLQNAEPVRGLALSLPR